MTVSPTAIQARAHGERAGELGHPPSHFADALSPPLLKSLLNGEGCSRVTVSPTATPTVARLGPGSPAHAERGK